MKCRRCGKTLHWWDDFETIYVGSTVYGDPIYAYECLICHYGVNGSRIK